MASTDNPWWQPLLASPREGAPAVVAVLGLFVLGEIGNQGLWVGLVLSLGAGALRAWRRERELAGTMAFIDALTDGAQIPALPVLDGLAGPMRRLAGRWAEREARLARTAASQRGLLDLLPEPLVQLAPGLLVVAANRAAVELLGDNPTARNLETVLRDPAVLAAAGDVMAGAERRDVEFTLAGTVPRAFRCSVAALPQRAADGTVAVLTLADLTAAKRMEAMRVDFVANASHEIRTPLAALAGYIETLRGPAREDAKARERFLGIMADQVTRMTRLVSDLLSLSRIELHEHAAPSDAVELGPLVARVAQSLEWKAADKKMPVVLDLPAGLPAALGDASEIEQVVQNLLDNAMKYGSPGTEVKVTARQTEQRPAGAPGKGGIALAISDRGAGIAREHLPRLTERFYRVDAARSRDMGGTGLGLAIVKHIISRHRGTLSIRSAPGEGSTFTVHLPLAPPESDTAD